MKQFLMARLRSLIPYPWREIVVRNIEDEARERGKGKWWVAAHTVRVSLRLQPVIFGDTVMLDLRYAVRSLWRPWSSELTCAIQERLPWSPPCWSQPRSSPPWSPPAAPAASIRQSCSARNNTQHPAPSTPYNIEMSIVAIIGASTDRRKFGNKALRAFRAQGYTVVPIHLTAAEVEGEKAYPSVLDYPGAIDEATVYLPAEAAMPVMEDIAKKVIPIVWLNPGADEPHVVARAQALGLQPRVACSILGIGDSPIRY